jgi:hypothetical protein
VKRTRSGRERRRQLSAEELVTVDGGVSGATGLHHKGSYLPAETRSQIYTDMAEVNPRGFAQVFLGDAEARGAYQKADIRTSYGSKVSAGDKRGVWEESQDPVLHGIRYGWERTPVDRRY